MLGMQSRGIVITKSIYFHVYHSMQLCLPSLCLHSLRWSFLLLMISWYWLSKSRSAFDLCIHPKSSTFLLRKTSSYGIWILDRVRLSTNMCFVGFDWHCFVTYKSKKENLSGLGSIFLSWNLLQQGGGVLFSSMSPGCFSWGAGYTFWVQFDVFSIPCCEREFVAPVHSNLSLFWKISRDCRIFKKMKCKQANFSRVVLLLVDLVKFFKGT